MHFFTFLLKNLLRRPARSLLTIVGLAVAVGAVVSLVGVATGFENEFMHVYNSRDVDIVVQRSGGGAEKMNRGLPEDLQEPIARVKGVKQVVGGLVNTFEYVKGGLPGLMNGWAPDCPLFENLTLIDGRRLKDGDEQKIMIGRVLAANLNKKVGDKMDLYAQDPFEVVGIYESPITFENAGSVVLLKDLQTLMNRPKEVAGYTITAVRPIDEQGIKELCKKIDEIDPKLLEAKPSSEFVQNVQQIKLARGVAWITSAIALFIGAIGMLNTMIMSVFERTKEIGTLRAIGWKRRRIVQMVLGESVLLSIGGAILGSVVGVLLVKGLTQLPVAAGVITGRVGAPVLLQGFLVALGVGLVGSIYPALWSANLLPTEALRRK